MGLKRSGLRTGLRLKVLTKRLYCCLPPGQINSINTPLKKATRVKKRPGINETQHNEYLAFTWVGVARNSGRFWRQSPF